MSFSLCFNQPETSTWGLGEFGQNRNFFKWISHRNHFETRLVIFPLLSVYTCDFLPPLSALARFPLLTINPHSQITDRSDMMDCFLPAAGLWKKHWILSVSLNKLLCNRGTWETARACVHSSPEMQLSTDQSVDDWHCSKASRGIENRKLASEILDKNQRIDTIRAWPYGGWSLLTYLLKG